MNCRTLMVSTNSVQDDFFPILCYLVRTRNSGLNKSSFLNCIHLIFKYFKYPIEIFYCHTASAFTLCPSLLSYGYDKSLVSDLLPVVVSLGDCMIKRGSHCSFLG